MLWVIIIAALAITLFLVWASADVGSNIYLKSMCRVETNDRVAILTFDDGPDEVMTPKVLDTLKRHNIKATFFLIGANVERYPHIVRRIVDEGHIVANHTYSHSGLFPLRRAKEVKRELIECQRAIHTAVGLYPKLFRPPFGVTNPIIGGAVKELGFKTIGWNIRSLDTVSSRSRESICRRVVERLTPGAIILLHDRCANADELLENIVVSAKSRGYEFTTLNNIDAYEI